MGLANCGDGAGSRVVAVVIGVGVSMGHGFIVVNCILAVIVITLITIDVGAQCRYSSLRAQGKEEQISKG